MLCLLQGLHMGKIPTPTLRYCALIGLYITFLLLALRTPSLDKAQDLSSRQSFPHFCLSFPCLAAFYFSRTPLECLFSLIVSERMQPRSIPFRFAVAVAGSKGFPQRTSSLRTTTEQVVFFVLPKRNSRFLGRSSTCFPTNELYDVFH